MYTVLDVGHFVWVLYLWACWLKCTCINSHIWKNSCFCLCCFCKEFSHIQLAHESIYSKTIYIMHDHKLYLHNLTFLTCSQPQVRAMFTSDHRKWWNYFYFSCRAKDGKKKNTSFMIEWQLAIWNDLPTTSASSLLSFIFVWITNAVTHLTRKNEAG